MTPALSPPRRTKTSAVFATICMMTVARTMTGASASPHQPGSGAHEAQAQALAVSAPATPCSWSEHYVNASAVPLAAVHVHMHVRPRGLRSPSAAQPDTLHCGGCRSPECVLRDERVRSLMPGAAWEDCDESQGADSGSDSGSGSSRRHPALWPHDVTAVSSSDWDQDMDTDIVDLPATLADAESSSSHPLLALSWTANSEVQERHGRGALALDAGGGSGSGTCPPRSSAAPAMRELALHREREREHEAAPLQPRPRSRSGTVNARREYGPMLRRPPPSGISTSMSKSSAAHASLESAPRNTGSLAEAAAGSSRSFLGALYASYSLWELASVLAAIAWLLVCLAA